jgi:hypothetical protein
MFGLFAVAGSIGCGTEAPAPDKPTWADDVMPILQANCFHCHGPVANQKWATNRWDVYDLSDPTYADLGFGPVTDPNTMVRTFVGVKDSVHWLTVPIYVSPESTDDARMPPPPANRLSARDVQVLVNFGKTGFTPGSHSPNHKPAITWLEKNKTFAVTDEDGDQVLGKLDCGGTEVPIPFAGRHTLPSDATGPCTGSLYDGWDQRLTNVSLK